MQQSTKNLLRWITVLPGAILGGFLASFPLHWILYFTLARGEIIFGVNIEPIEYTLYPFAIAITFILIGSKIAPNNKFKTSVVLTCLWMLSFLAIFLFFSDSQTQFGIRGIGSLLGSLLGLFIVWKKFKHGPSAVRHLVEKPTIE